MNGVLEDLYPECCNHIAPESKGGEVFASGQGKFGCKDLVCCMCELQPGQAIRFLLQPQVLTGVCGSVN